MTQSAGITKFFGTLLVALILSACTPAPRPIPPEPPAEKPTISPQSSALAAYYEQVQNSLLSQGLLRTDGGSDLPLTAHMLATNFLRIAFYEEYSGGGLIAKSAPISLTRWQDPVRVSLRFGASVSQSRQAADRVKVASYLARLARLTGHDIALSDTNPNFFISIANVDERRALGPKIRAALPQLNAAQVSGVTNLDKSTYCLVWTQSDTQSGNYKRAFVYIPAEHPDLMRLACLHEELAQGLGLPNDSGLNRPSIFNDDEEFALLTRQDELMLSMLYDPSLRSGMTEAEARPIVQSLARRLLDGNS